MTRSILASFLTALLSAGQPAPAAEPAKPDAMIDLNLAGLDLNAAVEALSAHPVLFSSLTHTRNSSIPTSN
jgi:hypothetical protein